MASNISSRLFFLAGVLATSLVISCASRKASVSHGAHALETVSRAERIRVVNEVIQRQAYYTTFSGRAKSQITINEAETHDITANIRVERGKAIWISATALMGVEVGRVLITPDSVKVLNRLRSEYLVAPFDTISSFTGSNVSFANLESAIVGNVIEQALSKNTDVLALPPGNVLSGTMEHANLSYQVRLNENYRPVSMLLERSGYPHRMEAAYSGYQSVDGRMFPLETMFVFAASRWRVQAQMNYSRVAYDESLELPFSIPSSYKAIQ